VGPGCESHCQPTPASHWTRGPVAPVAQSLFLKPRTVPTGHLNLKLCFGATPPHRRRAGRRLCHHFPGATEFLRRPTSSSSPPRSTTLPLSFSPSKLSPEFMPIGALSHAATLIEPTIPTCHHLLGATKRQFVSHFFASSPSTPSELPSTLGELVDAMSYVAEGTISSP
jgi:hypothetical protein